MKIKSRKQLIKSYNESYPNRTDDIEYHLRLYFQERNWDIEKASVKAKRKLEKIMEEREYQTIHITMYEYPMKTDRPRVFRNHMYSPNAADNHKYFEKAFKSIIKNFNLINTPATILIEAYMEMPKQIKPDGVILFEGKVLDVVDTPDYDNIGKCYTDILKNTLVTDDDLFHEGTIKKYYSVLPRVEITIRYLMSHESEYIYKKIKSRKTIKELISSGQLTIQKLNY